MELKVGQVREAVLCLDTEVHKGFMFEIIFHEPKRRLWEASNFAEDARRRPRWLARKMRVCPTLDGPQVYWFDQDGKSLVCGGCDTDHFQMGRTRQRPKWREVSP